MTEPMTFYVAGPLSDNDPQIMEQNINTAKEVGLDLFQLGHFPFIPHLTHYADLWAEAHNYGMGYEDYMDWDIHFLKLCEGFLFIDSSPGADRERAIAEELGLEIYEDVNDVPAAL
jgi:hypothetical protein